MASAAGHPRGSRHAATPVFYPPAPTVVGAGATAYFGPLLAHRVVHASAYTAASVAGVAVAVRTTLGCCSQIRYVC